MLQVRDLNVFYGGIHALRDISFDINEGEIVTLVGSNGAGKSTTLRAISGLLKGKTGSIHYKDKKIDGMPSEKIVELGISHVPEGRRIFTRLDVEENLLMGAYLRNDKKGIQEDLEYSFTLFPRLRERRKQPGGTLSGGEQQMLAIARALMARPKLLMLDEPSMGLAPIVVEEIFQSISDLNKKGLTVLLVEQNANIALQVSHTAFVVETGSISLSGKALDLLNDDRVRKAYLGED